jgi:C-terminal processing protease CtpA/Prc
VININSNSTTLIQNYNQRTKQLYNDSLILIENVKNLKVDGNKVEDLIQLGKIWGFLKYFHPSIAAGVYNWDLELFKFIPTYLANNKESKNEIIMKWINSFGLIPTCTKCTDSIYNKATYKNSLVWIYDKTKLGIKLSQSLVNIKKNRHIGEKYYVNIPDGVRNPTIKNESTYSTMEYNNDGLKLLALFRYWNIIEYWYPHKHLIDVSWESILRHSIRDFLNAKSEFEYLLSLKKLVSKIEDSHSFLRQPQKNVVDSIDGVNIYPAKLEYIEKKAVVVQNILEDNLLKEGDVILSVNNIDYEEYIKIKFPYTSGSNINFKMNAIISNLLRSNENTLNINIKRGIEIKTLSLPLIPLKRNTIYPEFLYQRDKSYFKISNNIGYINISKIRPNQIVNMFKEFEMTKGIIIDNRVYPFFFLLNDISKYLIPDSVSFVRTRSGTIDYPGLFYEKDFNWKIGGSMDSSYKGKILILTNHQTLSSGEFHTLAFMRSPNAMVVGSETAGADGDVTTVALPGNVTTGYSGISILTIEGKETQRIGIVPNTIVYRTIKGVSEKKDEILEKAISIIREQ